MRLFHLSHTDLDGYGCQLVTSILFENAIFLNANYGDEIIKKIEKILSSLDINDTNYILITDLNLSLQEAAFLEEEVTRLKKNGFDIKLELLDHHASGAESAERFKWYYLDVTRSASKITFDRFFRNELLPYSPLFDAINAVDIWLTQEEAFESGKVLMRAVEEAKEINRAMFPAQNVRYRHHMLLEGLKYLNDPKGYIRLDEDLCKIKKSFFKRDQEETFDNLVTQYVTALLAKEKDRFTIEYKEFKGILTYGVSNSSIVGNGFLKQNPDYHFFMNVSPKGTFSLRADNKMDVSKMAYDIALGGGHPNASGGKFKNFGEFFDYENLKEFVQLYLDQQG